MTLTYHPLANLFPLIEGEEFDALVRDIAEHGVLDPIVLLDGMILDGRNRYRAATAAGHAAGEGDAAFYRFFDPALEGDALAFVLSKNLSRRHMDVHQRAMVAASLATMRQGERTDQPSANLPKVDQDTAARLLHVSPRSLRSAKKVQEKGSAALKDAVMRGDLAVSVAAQAADHSDELQDEVARLAGEGKVNPVRTAVKKAARAAKEVALGAKQKALPSRRYGVVLMDPEHRFEVWSRETGLDRGADNHYPTSTQADLSARDIESICAPDVICGMWITDLARGVDLMRSYGFTVKSYFVWVKDIVQMVLTPEQRQAGMKDRVFADIGPAGTGYWNRDRDEIFLIGTRGHVPCPAMGTQGESVWFAARPRLHGEDRGTHSAKPDIAHEWFETHFPHLPKIELNARRARPGWDVWGNEAPDGHTVAPEMANVPDAPAGEPSPISPATLSDVVTDNSARWRRSIPVAEPMEIPDFLRRK